MKCEICGKLIIDDYHTINNKNYHNGCIEKLVNKLKEIKEIKENQEK